MRIAPALTRIRSATPGIVSPTLNVGLIKGGINTNVVPDQVVFRIDRRMIPEEDPAEGGGRTARADRGGGRRDIRESKSTCAGCCWRSRCARSPAPIGSPP